MTSSKVAHARPLPREEDHEEGEITVERRARTRIAPGSQIVTRRVPVVDEWLIAIARGEVDPDADPFGGLIPVDDDGNEIF